MYWSVNYGSCSPLYNPCPIVIQYINPLFPNLCRLSWTLYRLCCRDTPIVAVCFYLNAVVARCVTVTVPALSSLFRSGQIPCLVD